MSWQWPPPNPWALRGGLGVTPGTNEVFPGPPLDVTAPTGSPAGVWPFVALGIGVAAATAVLVYAVARKKRRRR